ncbi:hypothetical protein [Poseidonibacter ostreae]|uniref:Phage integrase SAM-like domain-containing protein n=1 Tax=Poseidonibacter ostreae TaxID=2654171 RepID=A0A6L4WXD0_9BACT|nr:hypothetical protein [Poseidonibacter ostreae]KAB7891413.1 hypothetical protein GBG19_00830 [Poseidonibacter ostreae]
MTIGKYKIEESKVNDFVMSLKNYFDKHGKLTSSQEDILKDIVGIKIELLPFKMVETKVYKKYFFRTDFHGDYLTDYDLTTEYKETKILDKNLAEHDVEKYIDEYKEKETITIPSIINKKDTFLIYYDYFIKLYEKLGRDKFRSVRGYNNCVRALNSIVKEEYNEKLISKAIGRFFK